MSKIQVSAKMKIHHDKLEEFKQMAMECIRQVKEKDRGTLQYDWFLSGDDECEIRETYESSEAALAHQSNVKKPLQMLFEKFGTPTSVEIYGDPSPELLDNAIQSGIGVKIFSYLQGL